MKKLNLILWSLCFMAFQTISAQTFTGIDVRPGTGDSDPQSLTAYNGKIFFSAAGDIVTTGRELWMSDGTQAGTVLVKDINPGVGNSDPKYLFVANGKLFFTATDGTHGTELWVSDGTTAGTTLVSDIWAGAGSSSPFCFTSFNGKLYFTANDSIHGYELWVSDGTPGGTSIVKDIFPGTSNSNPQGFALNPDGGILFTYNEFNGKLYFRADDGTHGSELWSTDGTTIGTAMVADILPGPGSSGAYFITPYNGSLIFGASDSVNGYELWVSDGTAGGTSLLKNINPNVNGSSVADNSGFMLSGGKLFFTATQDATGYELWSTDGTTSGTNLVKDILPGPGSANAGLYGMTSYHGKLYFAADDSVNGSQLWVSDGTASGTTLVKVLSSYTPYAANPIRFINYNSKLVFIADIDTTNGHQLWTSDGTSAGTHIISPPIAPNPNPMGYGSGYILFAEANNSLYMNANFNSKGDELWVYSTPASGITEASGDHMISAYPNPFSTSVTLSGLMSSEHYTVQILDLSGREYYSTELSNISDASVSIPDLTTGVYLMRVAGQSSSQTFKLVKN